MNTNEYQFLSRWRVDGTCGEVADVLGDPLAFAQWWVVRGQTPYKQLHFVETQHHIRVLPCVPKLFLHRVHRRLVWRDPCGL